MKLSGIKHPTTTNGCPLKSFCRKNSFSYEIDGPITYKIRLPEIENDKRRRTDLPPTFTNHSELIELKLQLENIKLYSVYKGFI